jgi:hypothetical protein
VQTFLVTNADKLGAIGEAGARKRLDAAVAELSAHVAKQTGNDFVARGSTEKQRALRTALLRDHMAAIARIAITELPSTPEFKALRMPRGRITAAKLAAHAQGMAEAAEPFADTFIAFGLPADFLDQLNAAVKAILDVVDARTHSRGKRRNATVGLKTRLSDGRKFVSILDAMVKSALRDDQPLLAEWDLVKRVPGLPARSTSDQTPDTSDAPESTASPQASPAAIPALTPHQEG